VQTNYVCRTEYVHCPAIHRLRLQRHFPRQDSRHLHSLIQARAFRSTSHQRRDRARAGDQQQRRRNPCITIRWARRSGSHRRLAVAVHQREVQPHETDNHTSLCIMLMRMYYRCICMYVEYVMQGAMLPECMHDPKQHRSDKCFFLAVMKSAPRCCSALVAFSGIALASGDVPYDHEPTTDRRRTRHPGVRRPAGDEMRRSGREARGSNICGDGR